MQASSMHGPYAYTTLMISPRFLQPFFMLRFQSTFDVTKKKKRGEEKGKGKKALTQEA